MDTPTLSAGRPDRASCARWSERVAEHCMYVRDWLAAPEKSSPRAWATKQCEARWLGYHGHLLAAAGLLIAVESTQEAGTPPRPLPLILGGADDAQVAVLIERAA